MKSTSTGISMKRMRSLRKNTAPFSTPTSSSDLPAYPREISPPTSRPRRCRSSALTSTSPSSGSREARARVATRWSLALARGDARPARRKPDHLEHAAGDHRARLPAHVQLRAAPAAPERDDLRDPRARLRDVGALCALCPAPAERAAE